MQCYARCYLDQLNVGTAVLVLATMRSSNSATCTAIRHRDTAKMLKHAKELYDLASRFPGSYQTADPKSCLGIHKVRRPRLCVSCMNDTRS